MEIRINYTELSKYINNFKFSQKSEDIISVSGEINIIGLTKTIKFDLKIERIGFSSITFSCSDYSLIEFGCKFLKKDYKNAIIFEENKKIKIDFKKIKNLDQITNIIKLTKLIFEPEYIFIEALPR